MMASWPRGTHDCRPGGGRCTLIAGAVTASHGSQRAAAVSESAIRAGARAPRPPEADTCSLPTHCLHRARARGRAETRTRLGAGPDHQSVGPTTVSPLCRRCQCRQSSRRTLAARQVRGTDSDTSRRRPTGRSRPGARASATTGPDETTRHGDAAAASCPCRFPVPFEVSRGSRPLRCATCAAVVQL
jgi:hypothetical protein